VAAAAKPAAQPKTAATPALAEPAIQTTGAGNEPVTRPAKRQAMLPAGAAPQGQQLNEEAPLQPAAAFASPATAPASPAAEPLKIVREAMPQADMAMQLARQQLQDNALREAIDTLQRALPQAGARADYHAFLAALLQRDDQHRPAAEHYATALRSAPDNGVWWMGLGISYQALQMATQAQQAYRSAQASRSLNPELAAFVEARLGQLQRP
jgi:MSHA biogenesis protein MshN